MSPGSHVLLLPDNRVEEIFRYVIRVFQEANSDDVAPSKVHHVDSECLTAMIDRVCPAHQHLRDGPHVLRESLNAYVQTHIEDAPDEAHHPDKEHGVTMLRLLRRHSILVEKLSDVSRETKAQNDGRP